MKRKAKNFLISFFIIFILSIIQIFFISKISFLGVKPNLSLIGLVSLLDFLGITSLVILSSLSGLIYGTAEFYFIPVFLSFLLSILFILFLKNKFLSHYSYFTKIFSVILATISFNFLFVFFNLILFKNNFFNYLWNTNHLIEIFLNIFVFLILDFVICRIIRKNQKFFDF